ncbi:MAG: hypothetical protein V4671_17005 [Armatimonadota bacterium]
MFRLAVITMTGTLAACLLAVSSVKPSAGQGSGAASSDTQYLTAQLDNPVSRLQKRLDSRKANLEWHDRHGFLRAVLRELNISPSSQTLVFSKTSLQRDFISPRTPRAIYFNDESYVAWIPDAPILEISTTDARWGGVFYTIVQNATDKTNPTDRPRLFRQTFDCISCHKSPLTENVPGPILRSVYALADGLPDLSGGSFVTTDSSPMSDRWGGWYVTGTHGRQRHMGNAFARGSGRDSQGELTGVSLDREAGANVTDLKGRLDTSPYLSGHSDIVALMVLNHQITVHNRVTQANFLTRDALRDEAVMNKFEGKPANERRPATTRRLQSATEPLVKALLFSGEPPLIDPVSGTSNFARDFAALETPRDKQGRSLRDLDLNRRLLRYPCSYLIYSEAFDALPAPARECVYQRIGEVVDGKATGDDYASLSPEDRRAIDGILRDTKPGYAEVRAANP